MYNFFLTMFFTICTLLTTLILLTPSKSNIIGSSIDINKSNNIIITSKFLKDTLSYIITTFAILFYISSLTLNYIYNKKISKLKSNLINKNQEIKIIKKK